MKPDEIRCGPDARGPWPATGHLLSGETGTKLFGLTEESAGAERISDEIFRTVREAGYFRLGIPEKFGGLGGSPAECCRVQMRLGYINPGLAVGLNMHLFTVACLSEHWQRSRDMSWMLLEGMARKNSIVASAFAEPSLGGQILQSTVTARRVRGGYLLSGQKNPCSLASRSQLLCLQARSDESREDSLIIGLLPVESQGLRVEQNNSMWGMQQSEADKILLTDCFLPDSLVFHRCKPGEDHQQTFAASVAWFCLTATSVYLGLCLRALDEAKKRLKEIRLLPGRSFRADHPTFQEQFGELWARYSVLESSLAGLCRQADASADGMHELLSPALAVKNHSIITCPELVRNLGELCGGGSYVKSSLFARLMADVQAIAFHPPVRHNAVRILGRKALGLDARFDMAQEGPLDASGLKDRTASTIRA